MPANRVVMSTIVDAFAVDVFASLTRAEESA